VETVGAFLQQALKSSLGEAEWLRFFALMGTVAAVKEGTAPVIDTPTDVDTLVSEVSALARSLDVQSRLAAFGSALKVLEQPSVADAAYFLLEIEPTDERVTVTGFRRDQFGEAAEKYLDVEKHIAKTSKDAVLVSVQSMASLKRAYPNYFADTRVFSDVVREIIDGNVTLITA
jgi:hypothetical protein